MSLSLESPCYLGFFRRIARRIKGIARRVAPVVGRVARTVAPITSAIPLPARQLIGRNATVVGQPSSPRNEPTQEK